MPLTRAERRELNHPRSEHLYTHCKQRAKAFSQDFRKEWPFRVIFLFCLPLTLPIMCFCGQIGPGCARGGCFPRQSGWKKREEIVKNLHLQDLRYRAREEQIEKETPVILRDFSDKSRGKKKGGIWRWSRRQELPEVTDHERCDILEKLPPELRLRIWKYVLAEKDLLHIATSASRPMVIKCTPDLVFVEDLGRMDEEDMSEDSHLRCLEYYLEVTERCNDRGSPRAVEGRDNVHLGALPLLLTSRQIYKEALPVLYSDNTFSFFHVKDFINFARSIPRYHLACIRSVKLFHSIKSAWSFPDPYINLLAGLQDCNFTIVYKRFTGDSRTKRYRPNEEAFGPGKDECRRWIRTLPSKDKFVFHYVECWSDALRLTDPPYSFQRPGLRSKSRFECEKAWVMKDDTSDEVIDENTLRRLCFVSW